MTEMEGYRRACQERFDALCKETRQPLVFGDGLCEGPVLMLIGEAPGEQESLQGRPFVGKAGKNLDAFLQAVSLRREDIYISNVVKMRPTKVSPAGRVVNRPPNREEKALFTPWLMREIAIVRPRVLVTLGNVALQAFAQDVIGNRHGRWSQAVVSPPDIIPFSLPLFALYHPASVIYNRSLQAVYERDLQALSASLPASTDALCDS